MVNCNLIQTCIQAGSGFSVVLNHKCLRAVHEVLYKGEKQCLLAYCYLALMYLF